MARHQILVLSAGTDPQLLATRNAVLKQAGYYVTSAATPLELVDKFFSGDYDLVILCHTISENEQKKIFALIHSYSPSVPVVVITADNRPRSFADAQIPNNPNALVESLPDLLEGRRP